jgi:6-phosphogluconolactonase
MCRTYGAWNCFCPYSHPFRGGLRSAAPLALRSGRDPLGVLSRLKSCSLWDLTGRAILPHFAGWLSKRQSGDWPSRAFGDGFMKVEVFEDANSVARAAAVAIAAEGRAAIAARGRFVMAVSGGQTPWIMLRALAEEDVPWAGVHVFQVDERVAPAGHPDRNLTHLQESLFQHAPLRPEQIRPMPVEAGDLQAAAAQYALALREFAGSPPVLDLVHLGLGPDGHTASLVPGDAVLGVADKDVAVTGVYQGRRRMTLTYPTINRARRILWVVTGIEKVEMLRRLRDGDTSIPAGRVHRDQALVLADMAAAGQLAGIR